MTEVDPTEETCRSKEQAILSDRALKGGGLGRALLALQAMQPPLRPAPQPP